MFDKDFNFITSGMRASGRTTFLFEVAKVLKKSGYKICFLGCTNEYEDENLLLEKHFNFDFYRTLVNSTDENIKIIELIKEISERDNYDFILIDDIDYVNSKLFDIISSIGVTKICTCLIFPNLDNVKNYNIFKVDTHYNDEKSSLEINIDYDGVIRTGCIFLNSLVRDLKINNVLG